MTDAARKAKAARVKATRRSVSIRVQHYEALNRISEQSRSAILEELIERALDSLKLELLSREDAIRALGEKIPPVRPRTLEEIEKLRKEAFG